MHSWEKFKCESCRAAREHCPRGSRVAGTDDPAAPVTSTPMVVAQYVGSKHFPKCFLMLLQQAFKSNDHSLNIAIGHINDEQSEDN